MGEHTTGPPRDNTGFDNDEPEEYLELAERFLAEGRRRGLTDEEIGLAAERFMAEGPTKWLPRAQAKLWDGAATDGETQHGNRAQRRRRR